MKKLLIKSLLTGCLTVFAVGMQVSCSDDWNEHFDSKIEGDYFDGSLMKRIESIPELSDFAEVLRATGYDKQLEKNQVLTILAPKNNTFDKEKLLDMVKNGQKQKVITEFLENHISRYNQSMDNEKHSIMMLNDKFMDMQTREVATIEDINVSQMNMACKNGVIHVLESAIPYAYNIYELLAEDYEAQKTPTFDDEWESFYKYVYKMQTKTLDEAHSIAYGISQETGENIWVDSVVIENNKVLQPLDAYIYREDSTYLTIFPSLEAYKNRVEGIKSLFNYSVTFNPEQEYRDSLQRFWANYYAMCDLTYNLHMNNMTDPESHIYDNGQPVDTLFSTAYSRGDWPYHVYRAPFGRSGILSYYKEIVKCSNGYVYKMEYYPFTVFDNVFKKITLQGENFGAVYMGKDNTKPNPVPYTNTSTTVITPVYVQADTISGTGYMHVVPSSTSRNTEIAYLIPNTLSGSYDIYVKFLPLNVYNESATKLPLQFRASIYERQANGDFPNEAKPQVQFLNPADGKVNFQTNPDYVDSLYIGTYKFDYCYQGTQQGAMLKLESYVLTSQAKRFTKEMLIDKIILIPNQREHDYDGAYIVEAQQSKKR